MCDAQEVKPAFHGWENTGMGGKNAEVVAEEDSSEVAEKQKTKWAQG